MKIEDYDLKEMIARAEKAKACSGVLRELECYENMEDLLENADEDDVAEWVTWYAKHVIEGRWPEAEHLVLCNPFETLNYIDSVVKGPWPEAEKTLLQDEIYALEYVCRHLGKRWPEAEALFLSYPHVAEEYAADVIGGRWPEAEPIIATDSYSAYMYAVDVIKGRWLEVESSMKKKSTWVWRMYTNAFPGAKKSPKRMEKSDED